MYTKYTGIILKKHPLGEADELLTIFTREGGKIRAKAPGTRKIKSRLAGSLQSLNEIEFETAVSHGPGRLPVIIAVRVSRLNNFLRENLKKFAHALVAIETLYRLTPDGDSNPEIYGILRAFLTQLDTSHGEGEEVKKFQLQLLKASGFEMPSGENIDRFLQEILERDIRANNFLETLQHD